MTTPLAEWVVTAMLSLAPGRDHHELAGAVAVVAASERPLFADDEDRIRTAALLVAVAFRESSLRMAARSKTGDHCAFQIHGRPDLAGDAIACTRTALAMLRESLHVCPAYPIAFYAEGPGACASERARRISRDRMSLAARLVRTIVVAAPDVAAP